MQVIARIPEVRPPVTAPVPGSAVVPRPAERPVSDACGLRSWTLAGLAVVALVAWGLASWNEIRRAGGPRHPERIAAQPPSLAAPSRPVGP